MALSVAEIKRIVSYSRCSSRKRFAEVGQRYYDAEHDILKARLFYYNSDGVLVEDKTRSNVKICHPFFTELSDQLSAFITSFDDNPIQAKEGVDGLQELLDVYFDDDFWSEISDLITGVHNKGWEFLYAYKNEDNRISFMCADSLGVEEIPARDADDGQDHVLYWYRDTTDKGKKSVWRIQDWTENDVTYYMQIGISGKVAPDTDQPVNPRPHVIFTDDKGEKMGYSLGYIPFFRLDYNRRQISALKAVKGLIDDYDIMQCGLSNNLADFDTPLHVVSGFQGDNLDELQQNLKTKKIVGVDAEGDVQIRTVDIPYQARKVKADEDEKNIYRFGMGFNSSAVGDGNVTNVVIRSRYTLLELKAKKLERRLKKMLKKVIQIVLDEINAENDTDYQISDVQIKFVHQIMTNETENISNEKVQAEIRQIEVNTILNIAANVGDEQTLKALCDVMDWDYEELKDQVEKLQAEQDTAAALEALGGVVTDEQAAETGPGAIPVE